MSTPLSLSPDRTLRYALLGDAIFETVCGISFIIGADSLAAWTQWNMPPLFIVVGGALLGVAALLYWMILQPRLNLPLARILMMLNLIFSAGGLFVLLVFWESLADGARWLLTLIALGVGIFGVLEYIGLRRLRGSQSAAS